MNDLIPLARAACTIRQTRPIINIVGIIDAANPIEERQTLVEHFSRSNDDALLNAAGMAYELTEMAQGDDDPSEMELLLAPMQPAWSRRFLVRTVSEVAL